MTDVVNASTNDVMNGTDGSDQLTGGRGEDTLIGGAGDDVLSGDGPGRASVALNINASLGNAANANAFSVVITGVPAGALLSAGVNNGNGTWTLSSADLQGLSISASDSGSFTLHVVATATDGSGVAAQSDLAVSFAGGDEDLLDGGDGNDLIDGGNGDDIILDGAGDDVVTGGSGDDKLFAGSGSDNYAGGEGFDTIDFSTQAYGTGGVFVHLGDGIVADMGNGTGDDMLSGIEGVVGSVGNDLIWGSAAANTIDAGDGDDVIVGGGGSDTLTGGGGYDTFVFESGDFTGAGELDTITDFAIGDVIVLSGVSMETLVDNGQSTTLYANINGQSVAVIELQGFTGYTLQDLYALGLLA